MSDFSVSVAEHMNDLGHLKRASSCDAEDPSGKKPRVTASLIHNSEEGEALDVRVSGENKPAPVEENGHRTLSSGAKVIRESMENSTKEDGSCDSGALNRCTNQLPIIEADAAEDRGSRHSMEDAWVVLPDASMDFPGTLRCLAGSCILTEIFVVCFVTCCKYPSC